MDLFHFYLEFNGRRTSEHAYDAPLDNILAENIRQAIEKFSKRRGLKYIQYEALSENTFRVYLVKKAFLKPDIENVYYVEKKQR